MYRFVLFVCGLAVDLFYRRRVVGERVPSTGPLVVVSNHPNGMVDPVIMIRSAGRLIRLLAKAPLFKMLLLSTIVKTMRCLPVYRAKDGHSTTQNEDTFRAVHAALADGDAIGLFPEGVSHNETRLLPLKTGAARMALGAEDAHDWKLGVQIVPMGLGYEDRPVFRSRCDVVIGAPIDVGAYKARYEADPRAAAAELTEEVRARLLELTLNLDDEDDVTLLSTAAHVWRDSPGEVKLSDHERDVAIAEVDAWLRARAPARVTKLRERIAVLGQQLHELRLDVASLKPPTTSRVLLYTLRNIASLVVGMPVALVGALAYALPFNAVRFIPLLRGFSDDVITTARVLISLAVFPLWHAAIAFLLNWFFDWQIALPVSVALPFAGLYAYRYGARRMLALRRANFLWGTGRSLRSRLSDERAAIQDEMRALFDLYEQAHAEPSAA